MAEQQYNTKRKTRQCVRRLWWFRRCFLWDKACAGGKYHKFSVYNDNEI